MKKANGNGNAVAAVIDRLGTVRDSLKTLKAEEEGLLEQLTPKLIAGVPLDGQTFTALKVEQEILSVNVEKFYRATSLEALLEGTKVPVTYAKQFLGEEVLRMISQVSFRTQVRTQAKVARQAA